MATFCHVDAAWRATCKLALCARTLHVEVKTMHDEPSHWTNNNKHHGGPSHVTGRIQ